MSRKKSKSVKNTYSSQEVRVRVFVVLHHKLRVKEDNLISDSETDMMDKSRHARSKAIYQR